ncbi:hypothetical protein OX284_016140 [Flavobacterium sp. SUN046]|uniref:hypothetical protein n=1 Tax=Flavobacterium sp. SUN046 TaxID=3002440 RepID=UPI002DB9B55C|nr:hypothetical protein [Flavobacterium sp. SUN046]MEC4050967.1 hypothetical protein [Flavobacterium sp. SUN046]
MRKLYTFLALSSCFMMHSQEHFSGLSTSSRVGILNAGLNPSELVNMSNVFEVNIYGLSLNVANNKVGFSDLVSGSNIENIMFQGNDPVNMRFNAEVYGPSLAFKFRKWAFGITTKANAKMDVVDVDTKLGDAISNSNIGSLVSTTTISNNYNQRINGTSWGEVGFTIAHNLLSISSHRLNGGVTFKMLFPGAYANLGADKFSGNVVYTAGQSYLMNTTANVNIAYSGSLANSFSTVSDYSNSVYGGLNGFAGDIGLNYQWKDNADVSSSRYKNKYRINAGMSVRNIGSMTFKDDNNSSTNYTLSIQGIQSLNLNQFDNAHSLKDIETTLINSGFLTKVTSNKDFKVNLPTTFNAYVDIKLVAKLFVSGFIQQKMKSDNSNDQITAQNIVTLTPRFNTGFFEVYTPISNSSVSGFNTGLGFRLGGFYLGSGSIVTALINDSKQADIYTGFRWSFL